jgi:F-type H+-transporting ATPase subunit a
VPFAHLRFLDIFASDAVMLFVGLAVLVLLVALGFRRDREVQSGLGQLLELAVQFVRDRIAIEFLGPERGLQLTPLLCTQFLFILTLNLLGLVPVFSCATGNINVTGALALMSAAVMIGASVQALGWRGFFRTFVVPGAPRALQVAMIPLEVVSLISKVFALMVRLFANMMAGHITIFAMLGLVVILGSVALPAVLVAVAVFFFELFVAVFQAYIFTLLSAAFVAQLTEPQH